MYLGFAASEAGTDMLDGQFARTMGYLQDTELDHSLQMSVVADIAC